MEDNSKYFKFPLKPQQEKAFEFLKQFVKDESIKSFILKGFAGTGKTLNWIPELITMKI